jgi:hypothetical protein
MISALRDEQTAIFHTVDQPVFPVDPPRPPPGIVPAQRLGFPRAIKGMPPAFLDQPIDLPDDRLVALLPFDILVERVGQKDTVHSRSIARSSSIVFTMPGLPSLKS